MRHLAIPFSAALLLSACVGETKTGDTKSNTTEASTTSATATTDAEVSAPSVESTSAETTVSSAFLDRPYDVFVPTGYDEATATPLVILLHGYGASSNIQEFYFNFEPEAEARGFLYVRPDGLVNSIGNQYWNGTPACCDQTQATDDSGYLLHIIDEVSAAYNVDQSRVYLVGHSNGGFMSYRMACEHADRIAAIVSLAGAMFLDPADCSPSEPVNILQIHGTDDGTIQFGGGSTPLGEFPSATTTVETWATYNDCTTEPNALDKRDIAANIEGNETIATEFVGCPVDGAVELWTIPGGSHIPLLAPTYAATIFGWLLDHPDE